MMKQLIYSLLFCLGLCQYSAFGQTPEAAEIYNKGEAAREAKKIPEAAVWYEKAAELGNIEAQYRLGSWQLSGFGVKKDISRGLKWLLKAAEGGSVDAMSSLADVYRCGTFGYARDMKKAFLWISKAAESDKPEMWCRLGDYYYYEWGVTEDRSQAFSLYLKAFDAGCMDAANSLGYCYQKGIGIAADPSKAAYCFRKAGEYQLELSRNKLYTPPQMKQWEKIAFTSYELGAQLGDAESCMVLAEMYDTGQGCIRNFQKANEWRGKGMSLPKTSSFEPTRNSEIQPNAPLGDGKFSSFAKRYVEAEINQWQKKGEFEKTTAYQLRVNETTRNAKIADLLKIAEQRYLADQTKKLNLKAQMQLGVYDADNETYRITCQNFDNIVLPVPIDHALLFKQEWERIGVTPEYCVENDGLALGRAWFSMPTGVKYEYSHAASNIYSDVHVEYNFDPIEINTQSNSPLKDKSIIKQVNITIGKSDVDTNIPVESIQNNKTFAVIIANEEYMQLSKVPFALNDSKVFGEYCRKTLGLAESNIRYYSNATYGVLLSALRDIRNIAESYPEGIKVLFYYAGHGAPHEATKQAYIIPIDADGINMQGCYALDDLYHELGSLNASSVVAFIDACFSGSARNGQMLASARGVSLVPKNSVPQGKLVVFSAASNDETALPYTEQGHGLFTYFLLKKLQETKGDVTLGELGDYVVTNVRQKSNVVNRKNQTPTITPSASIAQGWQNISLK